MVETASQPKSDPLQAHDSSSSEDEGVDITFPRDNAQNLLKFLHREINTIGGEDPQKRKFALIRLYEIFVLAKEQAPSRIYQELLPHL
jgi:hypothetical protein